MPPEKVIEVRAWFRKAREDLPAAELDLGATPPLLADVLFHSQQAAEKAIKGFLVWHDRSLRKRHDLRPIGEAAVAIDASLAPVVHRALPLTSYAAAFRYPASPSEPTVAEAKQVLEVARKVYEATLSRLPDEVRS